MIWKVVLSGRFNATLPQVRRQWSLLDLLTANELLEELTSAEARAEAKAEVVHR